MNLVSTSNYLKCIQTWTFVCIKISSVFRSYSFTWRIKHKTHSLFYISFQYIYIKPRTGRNTVFIFKAYTKKMHATFQSRALSIIKVCLSPSSLHHKSLLFHPQPSSSPSPSPFPSPFQIHSTCEKKYIFHARVAGKNAA